MSIALRTWDESRSAGVSRGRLGTFDNPVALTGARASVHLMLVANTSEHPGDTVAVQALFFAAYRDLLGTKDLAVDLPEGSTVADLVAELRGRGAPFSALPVEPAVAVNRQYAGPDERLEAGDEVAFIPPVAGG